MNNFNITIFNNKTFFEIIKEIKLFSKYKINHYEDLDFCVKEAEKGNHVVVFFVKSSDIANAAGKYLSLKPLITLSIFLSFFVIPLPP